MSKVLIIGHSVLDKIFYNGNYSQKPGGIFHSVNTIINIVDKEDEVFLLTQFSNDTFRIFEKVYRKVNLEYSEIVEEIPTVELTLFDDKEREEKYSVTNRNIKISRKINLKEFDVIYINMISGFDISLSDLEYLRNESSAIIYFDLHTFSRGIDKNGNRVFRKIENIEKWLQNIDVLQMNENEKYSLFGKWEEEIEMKKLFNLGLKAAIITEGKNGVTLFESGKVIKVPAISVKAINFVGCGDSFGAAFCYRISKNNSLISALKFANFVAGIVTTFNSPNYYKKLRDIIGERFD